MSRFFDRNKPKPKEDKEGFKGSLPRHEGLRIPASRLIINSIPLKKKTPK